jgi:hypothetical protein
MRVLCPVDATTKILVCQVRQEPLLPLSHANRGGRGRRVWELFNASKLSFPAHLCSRRSNVSLMNDN